MMLDACISIDVSIVVVDSTPSINYKYEESWVLYYLYIELEDIFRRNYLLSRTIFSILVAILDFIWTSFLFNINVFSMDGINPRGSFINM